MISYHWKQNIYMKKHEESFEIVIVIAHFLVLYKDANNDIFMIQKWKIIS